MKSALHTLTMLWPWTTVEVLNHLWQSTVVGLAVLLGLAVGRGLSARTRRALGWMALAKFALPASFFLHAFARLGAAPGRWIASSALAGPRLLPALVVTAPPGGAASPVTAGVLVTGAWFLGFGGMLAAWIVRGTILRRRIRAEMTPVPAVLQAPIAAAAARSGLRAAPRCAMVAADRGPGLLGVCSPMVVLPRGLEATLAPGELESVLIHEFVHWRRRDNLWSALQAFFVSLFWFHPVVWLLNRRLGLETEQSCDERVLEITGDPDTYAGGIVKTVRYALGVPQPGLAGATTPPVITRIKNILAHGARPDRPWLRGVVLAGGALLLAFSGYTGSFAAQPLPASAAGVRAVGAAPALAAVPVSKARAVEPTLSVDFPNEEIRQILSNVANLFELKVVMPDALQGKTTIKLNNVTWRQIFHAVLAPAGYTFGEDDGVVRIAAIAQPGATAAVVPAEGGTSRQPVPTGVVERADQLKHEAEAAGLAAQAADREAELLRKRADEKAALHQNMISLDVVNERLQASGQKMLPTGEIVSLAPVATATAEPAALAVAAQPVAAASPASAEPPAAAEFNGERIYDISQLDQVPVVRSQARPEYPFALRKKGVAGEATIDFIVDTNGNVANAHAVKFTHEEFATSAVAAVSQWKFRPGRKGGAPVNTRMQVPVVFTLNEN